jgi:hypothetical protein
LDRGRCVSGRFARDISDEHVGTLSDVLDGGFTTWTAQLPDNAKERCLVSSLATERLALLVGAGSI